MRVGSLERGVQWGWQVCWVEGWLGRVLWQRREREEDIGKKCSTALISNFGFITTVLCTKPLKFHFSNNTLRVASVFSEWNFDYHYKRQRQESGKTQRQCKLTLRAVFFSSPYITGVDALCGFYCCPCSENIFMPYESHLIWSFYLDQVIKEILSLVSRLCRLLSLSPYFGWKCFYQFVILSRI